MENEPTMAETWTINVNGRNYGPYTMAQMRTFAAEGRLAAHSLVAHTGEERTFQASEDSDLAPLFRSDAPVAAKPTAPAQTRPAFFTADGDAAQPAFGRQEPEGSGERTHFVIVADMKSRSIAGLEEEIYSFGSAYPIMPQAWVVTSEMSINAIRNALVQKLGKLDVLFVVDASHNKAAWFNFGPEADTRIRRIWQKTQDQSPLSRAG